MKVTQAALEKSDMFEIMSPYSNSVYYSYLSHTFLFFACSQNLKGNKNRFWQAEQEHRRKTSDKKRKQEVRDKKDQPLGTAW